MKIKHLLAALLSIFTLLVNAGDGKTNYEKGLDLFKKNQRFESIEFFELALKDKETHGDADIMLAIVYWCVSKQDLAIDCMMDYVKTEPNPYPVVFALWNTGAVTQVRGNYTKQHYAFFDYILNDNRANGTMKAMAMSSAGLGYRSVNNAKKGGEYFNKLGVVENWQVLGTFDNFSGNGFDKNFDALQNAKPDAVFKNKVEADIGWLDFPYLRNDKWLDLVNIFNIDNSIMFAQTFLNSPSEQEVYIRVGVSGSLKFWVNDALVASVREERNNDIDSYNYKLTLKKGYNRILVQIGASENDKANFMLRITDANGTPIQGLTSTSKYQEYDKTNPSKAVEVPHFAFDYLKKKIEAEPDNLMYLMLMGNMQNYGEYLYDARKTLNHATTVAPNCGFVLRLLVETYGRDNNQTMLTQIEDLLKQKDPTNYYALQSQITDAVGKEDYDAVEETIGKIENIYGVDEYTMTQRVGVASHRNNYDDLAVLIDKFYKAYPDDYTAVYLKFTLEFAVTNDLAKCNEILKKYLKNNTSDLATTALAANYFKLGMKNDAIKLYLDRVDAYPSSIVKMVDVVDIYYSSRDYEEALKWQLKIIDRTKYWPKQYFIAGNIYQSLNKTYDAIESYKKAIYYSPNYFDAREGLRTLEGKKNIYRHFESVDPDEIVDSAPKASDYPDDNCIVLLHDRQKIVYPEGSSEDRTEIIIKVLTTQGLDVWKEYVIPFNSYTQYLIIEKTEIIKKGGRRVQAENSQNQIVFTSLEVGDAIHIVYRVQNYYYGKMARQFWDQHSFDLFYPVVSSRYSLLYPKDISFDIKYINCDLKPKNKEVEGFKLYSWEMNNMPAIKEEPLMPPADDIGASIEMSSIPDWNFVANWYSDLSSSKATDDFDVKEAVELAFKGKDISKMTRLDKAKTIYNYILKTISYINVDFLQSSLVPQKASKTLNYKMGDCKDYSTLFVAMGNQVGLTSQLVLVDTRSNGENRLLLPSINFNHCVARVEVGDNKHVFVELTNNKLSFGALSSVEASSKALLIPYKSATTTAALTRLENASAPKNTVKRNISVKFTGSNMLVTTKTCKTGSCASDTRSMYGDVGKADREKGLLSSISSEFKTKVDLKELKFDDIESLSDTVNYQFTYEVQNHFSTFAGISIFTLPWSDITYIKDLLSADTRKHPICLWKYYDDSETTETLSLDIPDGKMMAEQPKPVKLTCPNAEYSITYTLKGTKLIAERKLKILNDVVAPANYAVVKDFFFKVFECDTKQLGFKDKVAKP
jgi:transglutaminase-like putative cysteine protease